MFRCTLRNFHRLGIFNAEMITEVQFYVKSIQEKFMMHFSSIGHLIISHVAKFKVRVPLVSGEINKRNLSKR